MALTKTVQYTPFQETSFGFGNGEVAADTGLSPTDIVKVRITIGGLWDRETGHISTPSVGTAVSTFNKHDTEWVIRGEVADVDAALAQLKFFPSDYEDTRTWNPTTWKDNQTTGNYGTLRGSGQEQPDEIPMTVNQLNIYNATDALIVSHTITWEPTGYDYDNNRPYFSVEPSVQDVSALGNPPKIDLGTIAHVPETDNVTVSCEFRHYDSTSPYTGSAYGSFTRTDRIYVGDKKEGTRDNVSNRFNFTGSLVEAQTFLDNIGYQRPSAEQTFDMMLRITDGVIGSEVTKTCWFSDYPFEPTLPMPDLVGTEEQFIQGLNTPSGWDLNHSAEVDEFWFTITLDATAQDGITYMSDGTITNGVYTPSYTAQSPSVLGTLMTLVLFQFRDDFNDDFTFDIQFHARNATLGTSYSSSVQTVNVAMTNTEEFTNLYTSHDFEEDHRYYFANGAGLPNINHGYNREYTARVTASDPNAVEILWTYVPNANYQHGVDFFWENGDQLRMVGTRDDVNAMLNGLYFEPATDYDQNFTFSYYQTRLGGDTTSDEAEGDYYNVEIGAANCISMTCAVSHDEYSFTGTTLNWSEDVSKLFDTTIRVTDLSDEHELTSSYQTDYTVYMKMVDASGNDYNYGYLNSTSTGGAVGSAGGSNPKSYTGSKAQVNQAIANMKYVPYQDVTTGFFIQFKIVRDFDGAVLADYDQTRQITFNDASVTHDEYSITTPSYQFYEDISFGFDSGLRITDLSDLNPDMATYNTDYKVTLSTKDNATHQMIQEVTLNAMVYGSATIGGQGYTLEVTGSKTDVNTALANLKIIPDPDYVNSSFRLEARILRMADNSYLMNNVPPVANFEIIPWTEYTVATHYPNVDWIEDTQTHFDCGLRITDNATLNADYSNLYGTNYQVGLRVMYNDGTNDQPLTDVTLTSTSYGFSTISGVGHQSDPLIITGSKDDVNTALQNIRMTPVTMDWNSSPAADGSFFIQARIERLGDSTLILDYPWLNYPTHIIGINAATDTSEYLHSWSNLTYTEDIPDQYIFADITAITDGAGDLFPNVTYNVDIWMGDSVGFWDHGVYVNEDYVDADYINDFDTQYKYIEDDYVDADYVEPYSRLISFTGTRTEVNSKIKNLKFSPYADITDSFNIFYKQHRYINGVFESIQTGYVNVGTVVSIALNPITYGTSNQNKQYFVDSTAEISSGTGAINPRYLTESWGRVYEAPMRVTDFYDEPEAESEYKITFTNASGLTLYDDTDTVISNNTIDWDTRDNINHRLRNGIRIEGLANSNFTLNFTLRRKTYSGIETDLFNGSLNYIYLDSPTSAVRPRFKWAVGTYQQTTSGFINDNDTINMFDGSFTNYELVINSSDWMPSDNENFVDAFNGADSFDVSNKPTGLMVSNFPTNDDESMRFFLQYNNSSGGSYTRDLEFHMAWGVKYKIENVTINVNELGLTAQKQFRDTRRQFGDISDGTYSYIAEAGIDLTASIITRTGSASVRKEILDSGNEIDRAIKDSAFMTARTVNGSSVSSDVMGFRAYLGGSNNSDIYVEFGMKDLPINEVFYVATAYSPENTIVNIQYVATDPTTNTVYLVILETKSYANDNAHVVSLHWDGTTATWDYIDSVFLRGSSAYDNHWNKELFLDNTFERLVLVESQYAITGTQHENKIKVWERSSFHGNYSLIATTTYMTESDELLTYNRIITDKTDINNRDVNYCDFNGSDTIITSGGRVFKKDSGGTDNWGYYTTLDNGDNFIGNQRFNIARYTQDYIVLAHGHFSVPYSITNMAITLYDKNTLEQISSQVPLVSYIRSDHPQLQMIETSKNHNDIAIMAYSGTYGPSVTDTEYQLVRLL